METSKLRDKWLLALRAGPGRDRTATFWLAESLLDTAHVGRIVLDERVDHGPFDHATDLLGLVHVYVDPLAPLPAEALRRARAAGADAYRMTELVHDFSDHSTRAGAAGETDGIWELGLLHRRADITREEFTRIWRTEHPAMVEEHHPGAALLRQSAVSAEPEAGTPPLDGIFEAYFPTYLDFRDRQYASEASKPVVMEDLLRFSDQSRTEFLVIRRTTLTS